jgi:N-acetylglucosaminyl-diphospho-decaprenol L-rhamnosyltransferase
MRYGAGLAVLVVGTGDEPFPATRSAIAALPGDGGADRLVLVDSGTPGGVPGADRDDAEQATVLRIGEDVGRGAAVNRAVAELPVDVGFVAVAPPRLRWADGALTELRAAAVRQPRAGILAPRVRADGRPVPSTHPLPRRARGVVAVLGGRPWPPPDGGPDPTVEEPVGWSSAPGLLLRRAALDSVDGFDPRYPSQLHELDLADRLARAGWRTVHVPTAMVEHSGFAHPGSVHPGSVHPGSGAWSDTAAPRRYLADRSPRPVRVLLRARY